MPLLAVVILRCVATLSSSMKMPQLGFFCFGLIYIIFIALKFHPSPFYHAPSKKKKTGILHLVSGVVRRQLKKKKPNREGEGVQVGQILLYSFLTPLLVFSDSKQKKAMWTYRVGAERAKRYIKKKTTTTHTNTDTKKIFDFGAMEKKR